MSRRPRREFAALPMDTAGVMWSIAIVLLALAGVTFVQSASALAELAVWLPELMRWTVPVTTDAAIVIFTIVALIQRGRGRSTLYPWAMVALFTAISIYANISHALDTVGAADMGMRQIITSGVLGGLAPFLVFSASHALSLIAVERPEDQAPATAPRPRPAKPAPAVPQPSAATAAAPRRAIETTVPSGVEVDEAEVIEWIATTLRETGTPPTAQAVGDRLGRSRKTGERFRQRVLDEQPATPQGSRRALEAVL